LDACLRSWEQLDYPKNRVEILLIDNGSDDGSELEAEANHPGVRLLRNPLNNFAAALNLGVAQSRGAYVVFANNDVFVDLEWLTDLVNVLQANPKAGCAGGKILFEDGRINSADIEFWKTSAGRTTATGRTIMASTMRNAKLRGSVGPQFSSAKPAWTI